MDIVLNILAVAGVLLILDRILTYIIKASPKEVVPAPVLPSITAGKGIKIAGTYPDVHPSKLVRVWKSKPTGGFDIFKSCKFKDLDTTFIPENASEHLDKDLSKFISISESDWRNRRGLRNSKVYLFYGHPGNGKTSLAMTMAAAIQRDILVLNLRTLESDKALKNAFTKVNQDEILLIEDIEWAFPNGGYNKEHLSAGIFLTCLRGLLEKPGVIIILTSLNPNYINGDITSLTDYSVEFHNPTPETVSRYLSFFYDKPIQVFETNNLTMRQIKEICTDHIIDSESAIYEISTIPSDSII